MKNAQKYDAYDRFYTLKEICEMVSVPSRYKNSKPAFRNEDGLEFHKIVFKGACELCDYSTGYLSLSIFPYLDMQTVLGGNPDAWQARFTIINIDDTMISGWSRNMSMEKVNLIVAEIAKEFEDVTTLGTLEEINLILKPYGIYAVIE